MSTAIATHLAVAGLWLGLHVFTFAFIGVPPRTRADERNRREIARRILGTPIWPYLMFRDVYRLAKLILRSALSAPEGQDRKDSQ